MDFDDNFDHPVKEICVYKKKNIMKIFCKQNIKNFNIRDSSNT